MKFKLPAGLFAVSFLAIANVYASQGNSASESGAAMSAGAETDTEAGTKAAAPAEDSPDPQICRKIKPTGTRFGKRVCMTQDQWTMYASEGRRNLESMQRNTNPGNPDGG